MKTVPEIEKKKKLQQRLEQAFPEEWKHLSASQKEFALDKYYKLVWRNRIPAAETLLNIANKGLSFGLLFLGAGLAVLIGLLVNIADRALSHFGWVYIIGVPVGLVLMVWGLNRALEESIIEDYRSSGFLEELLEDFK